jgi:hypothetical protein
MKRLIIGLVLLIIPISGYAQTYQSIVNQIRLDLRDNGPSSAYKYTDTDVYRAISMIEEQISGEARIPETSYSTTTVAGTAEYDLPSNILGKPTRVAYYNSSATSTFKQLKMQTIGGLDSSPNWENKTDGIPKEYYLRADKIGLVPAPSSSYATTSYPCLKIYHVQNPTDVSDSNLTSEPFGGYPQYQNYCPILITGAEAFLTKRADLMQTYILFLDNMSRRVREKYDLFINREPNRRNR